MKNPKILIVDDDPDIIKALEIILESQQFEVVSAKTKAEGMSKILAEKPDLLILDVMMEEISDGFDLSREIRSHNEFANIPIIMYTAIDQTTGVNFKSAFGQTDKLPIDAYLEKPVTPTLLLAEVNKLLHRNS